MSQEASALQPNLEAWAGEQLRVLGDLGVSTNQLASALAKEIETVCRVDTGGTRHAPDQFNLSLNSDDAASLAKAWDSLESALIQGLKSNLEASGYQVSRRLHLSFSTDPTLGRGDVQVIAWHSGDPLKMEETADLASLPAREGPLPDAFLVVGGQRIYHIQTETVAIGRRLDNDLVLESPRVSRRHALIQASGGRYLIQDLHSTAGTLVNGRRVRSVLLQPGDVIRLAEAELVYGESPGEPPTKAAPYEVPPASLAGPQTDTELGAHSAAQPPLTEQPKRATGSSDLED
jgi:hypothetical protein